MARKAQQAESLAVGVKTADADSPKRDDNVTRMLATDGSLIAETAPMSDDEATAALRLMMLSRAVDDRAVKLNRTGRIGIYSPVEGQEASVVGSCWALDPRRDWIVPAYREQPAWLRQGLPLANLFGGYMGHVSALRIPDSVNLLPRQVSIGAQLPQATGLAWGLKLQHKDGVVMAYLGEGASSEGDFHEACNLAGVTRAPIVFMLQNNGWAISTPYDMQTAAPSLAARAIGYGIAGALVDGNDIFAVYSAARAAVQRARDGGGATLIEARTYRMSFHNTTDNPRQYRELAEETAARQRDPIARLRRYLETKGAIDNARIATMEKSIAEEIDAALDAVEAMPRPGLDDVFENVYEDPPPRMLSQWAKMRQHPTPDDAAEKP